MAKAALTATQLGATYLSLSYGSSESIVTPSLRNTYYSDPDVTYVAAAGDSGYSGGALFPASAPNVVAAGGTSVRLVNGAWQQSAWSGAGSGCSSQHPMSALQALVSLGPMCNGKRVVSDLSALADPNTGMLFYRGGSWWMGGGTSLAAPILTSLYALAGNHTAPLSVYASTSSLVDVTSGSTGSCSPARMCSAGPGWDGPTGLGTPSGPAALAAGTDLPSYVTPTVGMLRGGSGYPTRLAYHLTDGATGAAVLSVRVLLQRRTASGGFTALRYGSTDLNGAVSFVDTPTKASAYRVVFAGNDLYGASTSATLTPSLRPKVRLSRLAGRLRARIRTPWGTALRSSAVRLQQRENRVWRSVRKVRTNRHGVVTVSLRRGVTYRLQYGGGSWQVGHTAAVKVR
jgi:5-hydroxyisourate hydrolase-like protein (transthyretin family)